MPFSLLLDLPPEIRTKILTLVVVAPRHLQPIPIAISVDDDAAAHEHPSSSSSFPSGLLLASSQLYHETRPLYFAHNAFCVTLRHRNDGWAARFLSPGFADNRRRVRALRVRIERWGSGRWFVDEFAPAIEDCILRGRLRVLEVVVRKSERLCLLGGAAALGGLGQHAQHAQQQRQRRIGGKERGPGHEALAALLRICQDPYLESVTLKATAAPRASGTELPSSQDEDLTGLLNRDSGLNSHGRIFVY